MGLIPSPLRPPEPDPSPPPCGRHKWMGPYVLRNLCRTTLVCVAVVPCCWRAMVDPLQCLPLAFRSRVELPRGLRLTTDPDTLGTWRRAAKATKGNIQ